MIRGKAWKFGDDISTDLITAGRYYHLRSNMNELVKHIFEDADINFAKEVLKREQVYIVVGGRNFGKGSSREHAARLIKMVSPAVLAKSFARIFYRNCFNLGLPALIVDTDKIEHGDELEIDLAKGRVRNLTKNYELNFSPIPESLQKILQEGGIIEYIKKYRDIKF
ncbi:MAG: 3-isopropylmalate dehydratase [Nitrososphaerales archaeon]